MHAVPRNLIALWTLATSAILGAACVAPEDARDSAMGTTQSKGVIDTAGTPGVPDSTRGVSGRTGRPGSAGDTLAGRRPPPSVP